MHAAMGVIKILLQPETTRDAILFSAPIQYSAFGKFQGSD